MKSYSSISETYLAQHGLQKYVYKNYLGMRTVAFLTRAEAKRRGLVRALDRTGEEI